MFFTTAAGPGGGQSGMGTAVTSRMEGRKERRETEKEQQVCSPSPRHTHCARLSYYLRIKYFQESFRALFDLKKKKIHNAMSKFCSSSCTLQKKSYSESSWHHLLVISLTVLHIKKNSVCVYKKKHVRRLLTKDKSI